MLQIQQVIQYQDVCDDILKINGIRFAALINKQGRVVCGGIHQGISPLEKDEEKRNVLFMEVALDLSMRKEFSESLGNIQAIVSYRDKVNIITIPHHENFLLLSVEPELESHKVIKAVNEILENPHSLTC